MPGLISTLVFILVALFVGISGLGHDYLKMFLGELEDESRIAFILVIAYIPAFSAGVLAPLFDRGWRAAFKTAFISSVISLILGILLSLLIGVSLGIEAIYGFAIWMSVSAPLYFAISLVSILVGYIVLLILIFLYR